MCVSVPSSPIWREGLGGGAVTFLVAEWPWGRGWVVMVMGIELGWGTACLSTPCSHTLASPGRGEGPVCAGPSWGEGLDLCPQRPQGKGEGLRSLKTPCLEQDAPQTLACPGFHPLSWVCLSLFPTTQPPCLPRPPVRHSLLVSVNHCLGLSVSFLSAPGAPVNMATWPLSGGKPGPGRWGCCKCCWEL